VNVLVTGASGFVGHAVCAQLVAQGVTVTAAVRRPAAQPVRGLAYCQVRDLGPDTDWHEALTGVHVIVHCAARVHVMQETDADPLPAFRTANVCGTVALARQAAELGVERLIYVSSVKVNGEGGQDAYRETDVPAPQDAYGVSKYEAEVGLREIAAHTALKVVVVRPPLVYGPGVRANFQLLMQALARGIPLPLGAIRNRRSLVGLGNLVDFIVTCIEHPRAANEIFFVSDGEDLSTTELIDRLALAMNRPARLIPVPMPALRSGLTLLGQREMAARLCGNLRVNITKARTLLGWCPPIRVDEELRRAAEYYLQHQ